MATGTTIADKLSNIAASKAAIIASLTDRCVTVPSSTKLAGLPSIINAIPPGEDVSQHLPSIELDRPSITSLEIPEGVTTIGLYAFYHCTSLLSLTIPSTVTAIQRGAFYKCEKLPSLIIPDSVKTIDQEAFSRCAELTSIVLPNGLVTISIEAFYGCAKLPSIIIPNSVKTIGDRAFSGCANLTELDLLGQVNLINERAFNGCSSLKRLHIGPSVTYVNTYAFNGCTALEELLIECAASSTIKANAFNGLPATCRIKFTMTMAEVKAATNYPWQIPEGTSIICQDGTFTVGE